MNARLEAQSISVTFDHAVLQDLTAAIPDGQLSIIIGPNACGKSTFLRSLARLQPIQSGTIVLDGAPIKKQKSRAIARSLAVLPQNPVAPQGLLVHELVARGRTPHQSAIRGLTAADKDAVARVLDHVGLSNQANQSLDTLSGGQRQRAWIAMVLAQETDIVLLDEPTTFLDLPHQIELLKLIQGLATTGKTVAVVLHDINLAARFGQTIMALKGGQLYASGTPQEVITEANMTEIFGLECSVVTDPVHGGPLVVPH